MKRYHPLSYLSSWADILFWGGSCEWLEATPNVSCLLTFPAMGIPSPLPITSFSQLELHVTGRAFFAELKA